MKSVCFLACLAFLSLIASSALPTTIYVNDATGDDSYDGLSEVFDGASGPKKTIQAGIDAALEGDKVEVADGVVIRVVA